jgi:vacuolar-type H+-ATPase subunit I/STV1
MPRRGIVNVRMVITEEKILSNIEKVQRLINPNSKKQIIELDDNSYFKDLVESIKTYLVEYPKKKNFPKSVYDAAYGLVEYATNQFEENTKQIEDLIRQRENNIKLAAVLKQTLAIVETKDSDWKKCIQEVENKFSEDVIEALQVIGRARKDSSQNYQDALKLINARVANLETNLHIEIDMERVEDRSKALSYIGIEIADALKLIPTPVEEVVKVEQKSQVENIKKQEIASNTVINDNVMNMQPASVNINANTNNNYIEPEKPKKAKSSLWNKIKNSKIVRTIKYALKIKVVLQLPEALPEGNPNNNK